MVYQIKSVSLLYILVYRQWLKNEEQSTCYLLVSFQWEGIPSFMYEYNYLFIRSVYN